MCISVIRLHSGSDWPLVIAHNRDEAYAREWSWCGHHWPDQPDVVGNLDLAAGGSWLAINRFGVVAAVLNQSNSTSRGETAWRSRGCLPLLALQASNATEAVSIVSSELPTRLRPFNLIVADARTAYLVAGRTREHASLQITTCPLAEGTHMIAGGSLDEQANPRIGRFLARFREAAPPQPELDDWRDWERLLCTPSRNPHRSDELGMFCVEQDWGTTCSTIVALSEDSRHAAWRQGSIAMGAIAYRSVNLPDSGLWPGAHEA